MCVRETGSLWWFVVGNLCMCLDLRCPLDVLKPSGFISDVPTSCHTVDKIINICPFMVVFCSCACQHTNLSGMYWCVGLSGQIYFNLFPPSLKKESFHFFLSACDLFFKQCPALNHFNVGERGMWRIRKGLCCA